MYSSDIYGGSGLEMSLTPIGFLKQPRVILKITLLVRNQILILGAFLIYDYTLIPPQLNLNMHNYSLK